MQNLSQTTLEDWSRKDKKSGLQMTAKTCHRRSLIESTASIDARTACCKPGGQCLFWNVLKGSGFKARIQSSDFIGTFLVSPIFEVSDLINVPVKVNHSK